MSLVVATVVAFLMIAASASADGTLDVTLDGTGSGTVTSTAQEASGFGTSLATPGQIDCATGAIPPHDVCSASFDFDLFGFAHDGSATLTATPDAGSLFAGWAQSGASSSARCTTPPAEDPTCQVNLNGTPGPAATVTATFVPVPDPPVATTGDSTPGTVGHLATLEGTVNPGGADVTKCFFEYGLTTEYGRTAPCTPAPAALGDGEDEVAVSATAGPLEPHTVYHYRLVAENLGGASQGDDGTLTSGSGPLDDCPNADIRAAQGIRAQLLPDCMALELVTPPGKLGSPPSGPMFSLSGNRMTFDIRTALAGTPGYDDVLFGDRYVAGRGSSGWSISSTPLPTEFDSYGYAGSSAKTIFTAGLDHWLRIWAVQSDFLIGQFGVAEGGLDASWVIRSPVLVPLDGAVSENIALNASYDEVSADLSHIFVRPGLPIRYFPGDPTPGGSDLGARNIYVLTMDAGGAPEVSLLTRDSDGKAWGGNCGGWVGGGDSNNQRGGRVQGAVSPDGRMTFVSARAGQPASGTCDVANRIRILERQETPSGVQISELITSECDREASDPGGACDLADGDYLFEGASLDQSKVYFTTTRQLADSDTDVGTDCATSVLGAGGCDLYLYDASKPAGQRLNQVSAGEGAGAGSGASVPRNVTAVSGDGSHAYFVAGGALTDEANSEGALPSEGHPNLYVYDATENGVAFIGTLQAEGACGAGTDCTALYGRGRSGDGGTDAVMAVPAYGEDGADGDGHVLVFASYASLTTDDADGGRRDLFRYDAHADALERVSRADSGGSGNGPFDVEASGGSSRGVGATRLLAARTASEDGQSIVFISKEALVPGDDDGRRNPYLWREGNLTRLPADYEDIDPNAGVDVKPGLSLDGRSVAFSAFAPLLPEDGDSELDIYVARAGGGFPAPVVRKPCDVGAGGCQSGGVDSVPSDTKTSSSSKGENASPGVRKRLAVSRLSKKARRKASRTGRVPVKVRASRAGVVRLTARAKLGKKVRRVGRASKRAVKGRAMTVNVRLSSAAKKRLRAGKKLRLTVEVRQSGARTRTRSILLPGVKR